MTTTGYGDVTPVTTPGRVVALIDMISGYLGLGLLIGYLAGKYSAYEQFKSDYFERLLDRPDAI